MPIVYLAERAPQADEAAQEWLTKLGNENWDLVLYTKPGGLAVFKKAGGPGETAHPKQE